MTMSTVVEAKFALDKVIRKQRTAFYKPIQRRLQGVSRGRVGSRWLGQRPRGGPRMLLSTQQRQRLRISVCWCCARAVSF